MLSKALIGGFFMYPPPPVSLETYMKDRRGELRPHVCQVVLHSGVTTVCAGEPGFLRGAELHREMERLCYRERRTFCVQAAVTMVTYSHRGEVSIDHARHFNDVCQLRSLWSLSLSLRRIGVCSGPTQLHLLPPHLPPPVSSLSRPLLVHLHPLPPRPLQLSVS